MKNYKLTVQKGLITWIENMDEHGNPIEGTLYIPKEAVAFHPDAWTLLGCQANSIVVEKDNPFFSSAHNCLLSKDGQTLIKVCKNSDLSRLSGLKTIGPNAFNDPGEERETFTFRIPDGVTTLAYQAFAMSAKTVNITVPCSVSKIDALAFIIHSEQTHIIFEGDAELEIGAFGTQEEAADSFNELYRSMPAILYPPRERLLISCPANTKLAQYCKKYKIPVSTQPKITKE